MVHYPWFTILRRHNSFFRGPYSLFSFFPLLNLSMYCVTRYFEGQFAPTTEVEMSDADVQAHVRVTEAAEKVA